MRFELLDNAANSLRFGLSFYRKYINLQNSTWSDCDKGYLKMTVICVHHSAELILKRLLSDINELLVISDFNQSGFFNFYKNIIKYRENKKEIPLFYFLNGEKDFHTIKYPELVERYDALFDAGDKKQYLLNLGKYRNRLMHMGIEKIIDYHEVLLSINGTLEIINELLIKITPYYKYEKECLRGISSRIRNIVELSTPLINECWEAYWSNCFEEIEGCLTNMQKDEDIRKYLYDNNFELIINWGDYEPSTYFEITIINRANNRRFILLTENIAEHSITLFKCISLENRVCFIYFHKYIPEDYENDINFIVFKKILPQKTEGRFWLTIDKEHKKNLRFSYDTLKREFQELLKNIINPYLIAGQ